QIVSGGSGGANVQQTIWQVQIGCLEWCWNSTQSQQASSQSTIGAPAAPPTQDAPAPAPAGPGPPAASPAPAPGPAAAGASPVAPAAPPPTPIAPPTPPTPASPVVVPAAVHLLGSPRRTGLAILTGWHVATVAPPARSSTLTTASLPQPRANVASAGVHKA